MSKNITVLFNNDMNLQFCWLTLNVNFLFLNTLEDNFSLISGIILYQVVYVEMSWCSYRWRIHLLFNNKWYLLKKKQNSILFYVFKYVMCRIWIRFQSLCLKGWSQCIISFVYPGWCFAALTAVRSSPGFDCSGYTCGKFQLSYAPPRWSPLSSTLWEKQKVHWAAGLNEWTDDALFI